MILIGMAPETPTRRQSEEGGRTSDQGQLMSTLNNLSLTSSNHHPGGNPRNLIPQSSLCDAEGRPGSRDQSLLAPPSGYSRERRHSSSSCESSVNGITRRRVRRNSTSKLSELESDKSITILAFTKGGQLIAKKLSHGVRKAVSKLFVPRQHKSKLVHEAVVMEEVKWICQDYIINKLTIRDLMTRKIGFTQKNYKNSVHVINAGTMLEMMYSKVYSNVSRKLAMTMSSAKIVRSTLLLFLESLFEGNITWGKIVSMFAVAGLFAEECASQGHPDFVQEVVSIVTKFTGKKLLPWLVKQGGWDAFPSPGSTEGNRLSKLRLLMATCAATAVAVASSLFLDMW